MREVIVLFDGYSRRLDDGTMDANCTCTLIKGSKLIIVDTMTAWDRERIIEGELDEVLLFYNCVLFTHFYDLYI